MHTARRRLRRGGGSGGPRAALSNRTPGAHCPLVTGFPACASPQLVGMRWRERARKRAFVNQQPPPRVIDFAQPSVLQGQRARAEGAGGLRRAAAHQVRPVARLGPVSHLQVRRRRWALLRRLAHERAGPHGRLGLRALKPWAVPELALCGAGPAREEPTSPCTPRDKPVRLSAVQRGGPGTGDEAAPDGVPGRWRCSSPAGEAVTTRRRRRASRWRRRRWTWGARSSS